MKINMDLCLLHPFDSNPPTTHLSSLEPLWLYAAPPLSTGAQEELLKVRVTSLLVTGGSMRATEVLLQEYIYM